MGNCIRHEAPMQWSGKDWESPASEMLFSCDLPRDETLLEDHKGGFHSYSTTKTVKEVKIKITKKQLEELLGSVDVQGLSVQQVLAQLMTVSDRYETQQRSWRPALQSIPE